MIKKIEILTLQAKNISKFTEFKYSLFRYNSKPDIQKSQTTHEISIF